MRPERLPIILIYTALMVFIGGVAMSAEEKIIFNFSDPAAFKPWRPINDTVMGGLSESNMKSSGKGTALFAGTISLENYGGFASVSSLPEMYNLSEYKGIAIKVKGDGKRYKLSLKDDTTFTGFAYNYSLATKNGEWMVIKAPFSDFVPYFRGNVVPNKPPIDRKNIKSFGFLISEKQEGPFRLEIESITAYK